jgi:nucleoside-diphosphate-sugar epimerase
MKVLVTGATGNVGGAVLESLVKAGHEVVVPTRNASKARSLVEKYGNKVSLYELDNSLETRDQFYRAAQGFEYIVHSSFFMGADTDVLETQTLNGLLDAARETSATRTVSFISTTGCLTQGSTNYLAGEDEATNANCIDLFQLRVAHENLVLNANTDKLHTSLIRPPGIYGKTSVIDIYFKGVKATGKIVIPQGNARITCIHVEDLGDLYRVVLENKGSGCFTPSEGLGPSVEEVVEIAKKITGVQVVERVNNPFEPIQTHGFMVFLLSINHMLDCRRARELYGFRPKHNFYRDAESLIKVD